MNGTLSDLQAPKMGVVRSRGKHSKPIGIAGKGVASSDRHHESFYKMDQYKNWILLL